MSGNLANTLSLLTHRERRRGVLVLLLMTANALMEVGGVLSVVPVLGVMVDPGLVTRNEYLAALYAALGFESTRSFLVALAVAAALVQVLTAAFRTLTHYVMSRYTQMRRHSVSKQLLRGYLTNDYEFFLQRNTSDLSKNTLSEVDALVDQVFSPAIQMVAYGFTAIALVTTLLFFQPLPALVAVLFLGGLYLVVFLSLRGVVGRLGRTRAQANTERFLSAAEVLGGVKEIKLIGREEAYIKRFDGASRRFSSTMALSRVLDRVPKFAIEALGVGLILGIASALLITKEELASVLPLLGLYGITGYRLLPAAQKVYQGAAQLRFGTAAVENIAREIADMPQRPSRGDPEARIRLCEAIELREVSYRYPGADLASLQEVSCIIPARRSIGIAGPSGSGKTTLVDLLLGLLKPSAGVILIDGTPIAEVDPGAWQRIVGYVPQNIFLGDESIAGNIAFGEAPECVDMERVREAARIAQLDEFISGLEAGYATLVGERGVRISGGQRQRIGIARALYREPELLVFDEATSALDSATEAAVIEAIGAMRGVRTVVMIAHRLTTLQSCDEILFLESGRITAQGRFRELVETNPHFREFAHLRP